MSKSGMALKWTTHSGSKVSIDKIDHQHLSNLYWYSEIVCGVPAFKEVVQRINEDFGGEYLPYRPKPTFKSEIEYLENMGYLSWKEVDGIRIADIIYGGHVVGEFCHIRENRERIINKLMET